MIKTIMIFVKLNNRIILAKFKMVDHETYIGYCMNIKH